ncbi:MAG: 3-dehydroquinate synthase [Rhodospirillales bacterium]|nr:3-dehydroquinate synthase [Rhodospirillales bacterium]
MNDPVPPREAITVGLGARRYDVVIGEGLITEAGQLARPLLDRPRVIIVTDSKVAPLYLEPVKAAFGRAGVDALSVVVDAGEETKDLENLGRLADQLLEARVERTTTLVALGGGVVGDLAGFAAAVILRGIDFIQIPTTLLAQVDSSIGGKTGINTRYGKNLIGAFYQPRLVLADIRALDTLPPREVRSGYAEIVKYGLIDDAAFFEWLEANGAALLAGDRDRRRHAVAKSCAAKASVVAEDERETGRRGLLNLGHTFGHALEALTGYGSALLHGEAVAIGMGLAFDLSARLGLCPAGDADRIRRHLKACGLPTELKAIAAPSWTADGIIETMTRDKKVKDGRITFILARGIGRAFESRDASPEVLKQVLSDALVR